MNTFCLTAALSIKSFFEKIDRFFTPKFETYEHLTFFNNPYTFKLLILGIYFGLVIASVVMLYNKRVLGGFVRKLDSSGCLSPETARTIGELGAGKNFLIKLSLRFGYSLRRAVSYVSFSSDDPKNAQHGGGNLLDPGNSRHKVDFENDKFYIPESYRDTAIQRFDAKGSGWIHVILMAVIGLVAVILIFKLMPWIVGMLENAISNFGSEPDVLN